MERMTRCRFDDQLILFSVSWDVPPLISPADEAGRREIGGLFREETDPAFRRLRLVPDRQSWFVAYRDPRKPVPAHAYVRITKTFPTEDLAKEFASERLAAGCDVTAGTINPHCPRRAIGQAQILNWLAEPNAQTGKMSSRTTVQVHARDRHAAPRKRKPTSM